MRCPSCNYDNPADALFCMKCGTKVEPRCSSCDTVNPADANFCRKCGGALGAAAASSPGPAAAVKTPRVEGTLERPTAEGLEGERKTVTALFADIKSSTELMRDLDPEEARAIIDPALKLMIDATHGYDGYVVQSTGDGIFALFGAPVAHEDHPQRALHAAIAMRGALRRSGEELKKQGRSGVEFRIGINTGEVVLRMIHTGGHTEYTPVGHAANLAARMQTLAPAGGVVISEGTRHLVEGYFELRDLGPTEVKGISEPINVYEVVGAGPLRGHFELAARRGLTKFVGRERELAEMKRALELARAGHGQIVAAVAEAGTGKSRLVYEFKATLPGDCKLLEAYSVSHGKAAAYLPVLELLYRYFGIEDADDKTARRAKIERRISALDPALNDTLPLIYTLMGLHEGPDPIAQMDPQIKRRRTLDAIKRVILRESLNQPTVVIFEDLHWIDSETQALLDLFADGIANARVLLLVNYRPEYRHEWGGKSYYIQLRLDPLGRQGAGEMLATLLGNSVELDPLKRMVIERTEGNPFFIEEMVQVLFDEGALVRVDPHPDPLPGGEGSKGREQHIGAVKIARSLAQIRLPPTVQGVLASRIDRLSAEQKELLQILAVMGRESPVALLREVAPHQNTQLERMLRDLQGSEFIYEQLAPAGVEYTFKHALTQEVAYNSLLMERRKLLHERAGEAIEGLFHDRLEDHVGELAHHYSRSANTKKALRYLQAAGELAVRRSAIAEAGIHFNAALDLLGTLPETPERAMQELDLQTKRGPVAMALRGLGSAEAGKVYARARELCQRIGDTAQLFPVLWGIWLVHSVQGDLKKARDLADELLFLARRAQDAAFLLQAHHAQWQTSVFRGEIVSGREHAEQGAALYQPELHRSHALLYGGHDPGVCCRFLGATASWLLGYPEQAVQKIREAHALAQELRHPHTTVMALTYAAMLHQHRGEVQEAGERAEAAVRISAEHGFAMWKAVGAFLLSWARAEHGLAEHEIAQMRQDLAEVEATRGELYRTHFLGLMAKRLGETGRTEAGLELVVEALDAVKNGVRWNEAELHRIKGELLLARNSTDAASGEKCFRSAIEIARQQSAKSWELRATMSLARLLDKRGHRDEARTMLVEIYGWFTEGFDTADLKEAESLLEEF